MQGFVTSVARLAAGWDDFYSGPRKLLILKSVD
jgi:hypothetical protein